MELLTLRRFFCGSVYKIMLYHLSQIDSEPTSNLISIKEVAIRTTFYFWNNLLHLQLSYCGQCTHHKNAFNKHV